jgi:flagella basal body P-ring formation protein FlgA
MMIAILRHIGLLLVVAVAMLLSATPAAAATARVTDQAGCAGPTITLGDVAELDGPYACSLEQTVVGAFREEAASQEISLTAIETALKRSGVNWGKLSLGGHKVCKVYRTLMHVEPTPVAGIGAAANVHDPFTLDTPTTLRDLVVQFVKQRAGGETSDDLRVQFNERDDKQLAVGALAQRYEIEPTTSARIGCIVLAVRRYDSHGRIDKNLSVTAQVDRRVYGLVATQSMRKGRPFASGGVELRPLWLIHDRGDPIVDTALVDGQIAATVVRAGTVIYPHHIQSPRLVKQRELIQVRCISGLLVVRTTARAAEAGSMDDLIQVRDEITGHQYMVTVTGRRQGTIMLNQPDHVPAPAAVASPPLPVRAAFATASNGVRP